MKHTTAFRYNDDEAESIFIIQAYINKNLPGTKPNISDAIRYALVSTRINIENEYRKLIGEEEIQDAVKYLKENQE